ncbi:MAG: cysteine desulfurase [Verrucomicrobiae bacterium]|nr:cysteine desulfurase [Verrucomicrobiae bacterium]
MPAATIRALESGLFPAMLGAFDERHIRSGYLLTMSRTIYFDYNATTPLDPAVRTAMLPYLDQIWGNPSSVHQIGQTARAALDDLRDRAAKLLKAKPSEIIFTSGGTESNNLAIFGTARLLADKGKHLITSAIEHHAGLRCFDYLEAKEHFEVTRLPVDTTGRVAPEALEQALRPDTTLVSIMAANNEIGTIQPVAELGAICRQHRVIFHTDAAQWFGKEPVATIEQFNADLVSICAHKFHGPKGAGLLYIRSPLHPDLIHFGGSQENERRGGTENLPAIAGLVEALERFVPQPVFDRTRMAPLTERLITAANDIPGLQFIGSRESRLANTVAFVVPGTDNIALMAGLDLEGICASSGSACSAGSLEPSHVVAALGWEKKLANSLVRFSLGRESTAAEVETVIAKLPEVLRRAKVPNKFRTTRE